MTRVENDRELLDLAAKAAGITIGRWAQGEGAFLAHGEAWSPLTNDGDALRLAVKLQLELTVFRDHVTAFYATGWCDELHGLDQCAATRRAIVRAAAEIGRDMT